MYKQNVKYTCFLANMAQLDVFKKVHGRSATQGISMVARRWHRKHSSLPPDNLQNVYSTTKALPPDVVEILAVAGNGNVSQAIRRLAAWAEATIFEE